MNEQDIKDRITLDMSLQEAIIAMVEGNPGALTVVVKLLGIEKSKGNKPNDKEVMDNFMTYVLRLDTERVYGATIWLAYKDICGEDIEEMKKKILNETIKEDVRKLPYYHE